MINFIRKCLRFFRHEQELSDDELDELLVAGEKSFEKALEQYKKLCPEESAFYRIKEIADALGRTPAEILDHLEKQVNQRR